MAAVVLWLGCSLTHAATVQHRLAIAANPSIGLDAAEVDAILTKMNAILRKTVYGNPWDAPCDNVEFVRVGPVIEDSRLLATGTFDELTASLKAVAPSANVLVVVGIDCNGIQAVGCGAIAGEPLIVGLYPNYDDQLWLHERGHNVGLPHSADYPATDKDVPQNVGMRFMFWQLGVGHLGKVPSECGSLATAKLKSIVTVAAAAVAGATIASVSAPAVAEPAGASLDAQEQLNAAAKAIGLTPYAYGVVGPPWLHGIPVEGIKKLSSEDLQSIRAMLKGRVNQYWPQAIACLATVGNQDDLPLIHAAMNLPMPAVAAGSDVVDKQQVRNLVRAKLAVPFALGIFANRTKSQAAVDLLQRSAQLDNATLLIGPTNAEALSKQALRGLTLVDTPASTAFIDAVVSKAGPPGSKIPSLTPAEELRLKKSASDVSKKGMDAYLSTMGRLE